MGFVGAYAKGFLTFDYHTETAATLIEEEVPAVNGQRLALISLAYLAAATAHTISVLYAKDHTTAGSSRNSAGITLSGQKDIICTVAPKDPANNAAAANDNIAFQLTDGTWEFDTVASLASSTITCTNNITGVDAGAGGTAIAAGGMVMVFGVAGDGAEFVIHALASVVTSFDNVVRFVHPYESEPLYVSIDNATNAGFLNSAVFAYINK